jgi:hypothetical protein
MGYTIQVVFGFEYIVFVGDSKWNATSASRNFIYKELIWTIDFRFGTHKVETTYIPSNWMQDFIDEEK